MKPTYGHGRVAVNRAFSSSDIVVLVITFVVFFLAASIYFMVDYFTGPEYKMQAGDGAMVIGGLMGSLISGAMLFAGILLFGMFMVRLQRQTVLGNSLQIQYSDYAWLRDWANVTASDLGLPQIEMFVTQDPVMNAYALGFVKPYIIVLNSGTIRYLTHDEIKAVVIHEMGHIKYGHTIASVYLTPFLSLPIINVVGAWLAGFWQRRTELTADRLALMYTRDTELVKEALIKVHVGPDVAKSMNQVARDWLQYTAGKPMNRFAQTFSNHPFLVRRLSHLDRWKAIAEMPDPAAPAAAAVPTPPSVPGS